MFKEKFFILLCASTFIFLSSIGFAAERKFYSQCKQDSYLYENVFKEKRNGVFVDIGASDGIHLSNTYFFEKYMGWTGICIEPIPEIFSLLRTNRKCICIQGGISDRQGKAPFLRITPPINASPACRIDMLSGNLEKYDPRHLERVRQALALDGGSSEVIIVNFYTFNQILQENKIYHVDYLSIDTEGGELDILKSIDFSRFDIDIINVENNYNSPSFQQFLEPLGYKKIATLSVDEIYKKG